MVLSCLVEAPFLGIPHQHSKQESDLFLGAIGGGACRPHYESKQIVTDRAARAVLSTLWLYCIVLFGNHLRLVGARHAMIPE